RALATPRGRPHESRGAMTRPTIGAVLAQLALEPTQCERAEATLVTEQSPTPWFVRVLIGSGAWLAAILFLAFLAMVEIVRSERVLIGIGVVLTAGATFLRRATRGDFPNQLTLAWCLAGQALISVGVGALFRSTAAGALALVVTASAVILLFPDPVAGFLSTVAGVGALGGLLHRRLAFIDLSVLALATAFGVGALLVRRPALAGPRAELETPVGYGLVVALLVLLIGSLNAEFFHGWLDWSTRPLVASRPTAIGLTVLLLGLEWQVLRALRVPAGSPAGILTLAGTVLFGLATRDAPGVIGAVAVLVL